MHSIALSMAIREGLSGRIAATVSLRVADGANKPFACCHFSQKRGMSAARSLINGRFPNGASLSVLPCTTFDTCVRQVQRGTPFTVIAQEPQTPTRQAKRYARLGSSCLRQ